MHECVTWCLPPFLLQVECDVGAPQVNYRESISRPNDIRYQHKKQSGGSGQFAGEHLRRVDWLWLAGFHSGLLVKQTVLQHTTFPTRQLPYNSIYGSFHSLSFFMAGSAW